MLTIAEKSLFDVIMITHIESLIKKHFWMVQRQPSYEIMMIYMYRRKRGRRGNSMIEEAVPHHNKSSGKCFYDIKILSESLH